MQRIATKNAARRLPVHVRERDEAGGSPQTEITSVMRTGVVRQSGVAAGMRCAEDLRDGQFTN